MESKKSCPGLGFIEEDEVDMKPTKTFGYGSDRFTMYWVNQRKKNEKAASLLRKTERENRKAEEKAARK